MSLGSLNLWDISLNPSEGDRSLAEDSFLQK